MCNLRELSFFNQSIYPLRFGKVVFKMIGMDSPPPRRTRLKGFIQLFSLYNERFAVVTAYCQGTCSNAYHPIRDCRWPVAVAPTSGNLNDRRVVFGRFVFTAVFKAKFKTRRTQHATSQTATRPIRGGCISVRKQTCFRHRPLLSDFYNCPRFQPA